MQLELKVSDIVIDILVNGEHIGYAPKFRPKNQIVKSIYYLLNRTNPAISKDLISYELDKLEIEV